MRESKLTLPLERDTDSFDLAWVQNEPYKNQNLSYTIKYGHTYP